MFPHVSSYPYDMKGIENFGTQMKQQARRDELEWRFLERRCLLSYGPSNYKTFLKHETYFAAWGGGGGKLLRNAFEVYEFPLFESMSLYDAECSCMKF